MNEVTLQNGEVSIDSTSFVSSTMLKHVVIGEEVDALKAETLEMLGLNSGGITELSFKGPNYFSFTGNDFTAGTLTLTEGAYYADENGILYRLEADGTAALVYYPPDLEMTSFTVPETIPSETEGPAFTVTAIGDNAFSGCTNLTGIVLPDSVTAIGDRAFFGCEGLTEFTIPENVTALGSFAFASCENLASVNGQTALKDVLARWSAAGANNTTFLNTALWDNGVQDVLNVTTEKIEIEDSTGRKVILSTNKTAVLTGEAVQSTLTIDKGDEDSTEFVRVYFQFDGENGSINYENGSYTFDGIAVQVAESDVENTYYIQVEPLKAGQTLSLNLMSIYENVISGGGTVTIWTDTLTAAELATVQNGVTTPDAVHMATWTTQADTFPVTKVHSNNKVNVMGDGTEGGLVTISGLQYTVSMNRSGTTSNYGKDHMASVDFVDTLTLPEHYFWREGLVDAVRSGSWRVDAGKASYIYYYVIVDGVEYRLATVSWRTTSDPIRNAFLDVDENGRVQIGWTYYNAKPSEEIANYSTNIVFGDKVIGADEHAIEEALKDSSATVTYSFANTVTAEQHFTYSGDQHQSASTEKSVSLGSSNYTISKAGVGSGTVNMGVQRQFTITLSNTTSLPYTVLNRVVDPLPDYFYIKPADMETMFYDDSYGKYLTITIANANLCQTISETVTGTDGNSYTITQQYQGVDTPYEDKSPKGSDILLAENATLTIGWSGDGTHLVLTVANGDSVDTYTIGEGRDYADIQAALDGTGYLITNLTSYTCTWDQQGQTLYSGEQRVFNVRSTCKDSYMRLTGDQDWYIVNATRYQSSVANYGYAYSETEEEKKSYVTTHIDRDFTLFKDAYLDGELVSNSNPVESGDVVEYETEITHWGANSYDALPAVDRMRGAQLLLVTVAENPSLADKGLETMYANGEEYYILNKAGTYEHVVVAGHLADHVTVSLSDKGADTMIYWYLTDIGGNQVTLLKYLALISPSKSGMVINSTSYTLSNMIWLNDHQTHRLYDDAFMYGTILQMNKFIVTNMDESELEDLSKHNYKKDELSDRSIVGAGETVTYRLTLNVTGREAITVNGPDISDALPGSLNGYWSKDNVTVTYVTTDGSQADFTNPAGADTSGDAFWSIESDPEDAHQQYLKWSDDFSVTIHGTVYIYVTMTFPTGQAWADYCFEFGSVDVCNTFYVHQLEDEVFHHLAVTAEVLLHKGVYLSGTAGGDLSRNQLSYLHGTDAEDLWYYTNDGQDYGMVTYYVTLYNSGISRLYLSDIQDVLPEGFELYGQYSNRNTVYALSRTNPYNNKDYYQSLAVIDDPDASNVQYKTAVIKAATAKNAKGQEVVTFSLSNSETVGNLAYDEELERYYLNPEEALVFAYNVRTNRFADSRDFANNIVAMPYYDYNGAGAKLAEGVSADRNADDGKTSRESEYDIQTNGQVGLLGMNVSGADDSTQWLTSAAALSRGSIMPGITKTAAQPFANAENPITWTIKVSNSGTDLMRDYTLTDVMMAPYQFIGAVSYQLNYDLFTSNHAYNAELFKFGSRSAGDAQVMITSPTGAEAVLTVNGGYQPIETTLTVVADGRSMTVPITIMVRLSRDSESNEVLSVLFPEDTASAASIPASGSAQMTLDTKNLSSVYRNTSFFNTAYITPSKDQPFATQAVNQGNYVIYNEADSVVSEANVAVSYGYSTTSAKHVTEVGVEGGDNSASSTSSRNYIVAASENSVFRYTLTVNNTGGSSDSLAMDLLVLIDNLPQVGDHVTFYEEIPRYSDFEVDFAADPAFTVSVNDQPLSPEQYQLQFTADTEFDAADWDGTGSDGWYSSEQLGAAGGASLADMRSFRVVIEDESATLIPAEAVISVSFNAVIDTSRGTPDPAMVAWNSFGYHYSLAQNPVALEAAPQKVGVKIPTVPILTKELQDSDGNVFEAEKTMTFSFVIYQGESVKLPADYTQADIFSALEQIPFTIVDVTVEKGESVSETVSLQGLYEYAYENGKATATDTPWQWLNQTWYTIVELPPTAYNHYRFGSINRTQPNNYTFSYNNANTRVLSCTNIRDVWNLQIEKSCEKTKSRLSGAVFGLYSPLSKDQISEADYAVWASQLREVPQKEWSAEGSSWYLMDIQVTDSNGFAEWSGLTEEQYYLLELQAPDGYIKDLEQNQIVRFPASQTVLIPVTNEPSYEIPQTGGLGVHLHGIAGALLMSGSLLAGRIRRRKRRSKEVE